MKILSETIVKFAPWSFVDFFCWSLLMGAGKILEVETSEHVIWSYMKFSHARYRHFRRSKET